MVAAVALGIVVDDTVHLLVAVRREMTVGASGIRVAIKKAIEEVGAPVVVTSVLMVASLSVLTLGSFAPSVNFGFIAITIVIAALLADLLILPEMLAIADRRRPLFAETAETAEE